MQIKVKDESVDQRADIAVMVNGGKVTYWLEFRCDHRLATVFEDDHPFAPYSVFCISCKNEDLTEQEAEALIEEYKEDMIS